MTVISFYIYFDVFCKVKHSYFTAYQSAEDPGFTFTYARSHTPVVTEVSPRVITNQNTTFNITGRNLGTNVSDLVVVIGSFVCNGVSLTQSVNSSYLQCLADTVQAGGYDSVLQRIFPVYLCTCVSFISTWR